MIVLLRVGVWLSVVGAVALLVMAALGDRSLLVGTIFAAMGCSSLTVVFSHLLHRQRT